MVGVWVAVMVIGLIGMIVCGKKQRTNPAMQPISFLLFIVVLVGAFMWLKTVGVFGGGRSRGIIENEKTFQAARGFVAAEVMKKAAPGKKVLFLTDPGYENDIFAKELVESFKRNYSENTEVVTAWVELPANFEELGVGYTDIANAKKLDELINNHSDAGVIISLFGLPADAHRMKFFSKKDHAPFMTFGTGAANRKWVVQQLQKGSINGVVIRNSTAKYDTPATDDERAGFDVRYILITKDNAAELNNR